MVTDYAPGHEGAEAFTKAFAESGGQMVGSVTFPPDFESADAWDGMKAIFQLVEHTEDKFTGDEAMAFLKNWKDPNSPKGPVMIDP